MFSTIFPGLPRTVENHNSIAQFSSLNPQGLKGEQLYHFCQGMDSCYI